MPSRRLPVLVAILTLLAFPTAAHDEEPAKLLGSCTTEQLGEEPFSEWSQPGYDEYTPNAVTMEALRDAEAERFEFTVFFGTWCGDSRREVPRILKVLDGLELPEGSVELVALDRIEEALKQSPGGEERGREIYRVPTLIVERDGQEISRLVEHPDLSVERDLLAILEGREYARAYPAYPVIREWLEQGLLADPNISPRGLANRLRNIVAGEGDLAAAARVLQTRGDLAEATKLFEVNCDLHWDSSRSHARLAEALLEAGELERARQSAERALKKNENPEQTESLLELIRRSAIAGD